MNIYLLGFMGAGKTTIGKKLAAKLNYKFVDLDEYIEEKQKLSIPKIFQKHGENKFREYEKEALNETFEFKNTIISTGGGAPCFFDNIEQINKNATSIYLKFPAEILASRIKSDSLNERPLAKQKNREELIQFTKEKLEEREKYYSQAKIIISEPRLKPNELVNLILKKLENS